jgi:hypothetical protein
MSKKKFKRPISQGKKFDFKYYNYISNITKLFLQSSSKVLKKL